ncbi:hypothetical protein MSG28_007131 [Choristoneura fumiferana]|uniref:Uncharacterized protein n=1 Tax=Choristoneura fumiferana TaxID=7141 RepID=A0ACC0JMR3_CHOFU|nr:hypothetical protein MSG28_007131 [Choristoneura fumiferana]
METQPKTARSGRRGCMRVVVCGGDAAAAARCARTPSWPRAARTTRRRCVLLGAVGQVTIKLLDFEGKFTSAAPKVSSHALMSCSESRAVPRAWYCFRSISSMDRLGNFDVASLGVKASKVKN